MVQNCGVRGTWAYVVTKSFVALATLFLGAIPFRIESALATEQGCVEAADLVRRGVELGDGSSNEQELYQKAKALCPKMAEAHFNLGLALQRSGKLSEGEQELRESLRLKDDPNFRIGLAGVLLQKGELALARGEYNRVIDQDGKNVQALQGLAVVHEKQKEPEKALEILTKASGINPIDFVTHFNLAALQEKMGRYDAAIESYKRALESRPKHFETLYYLGLLQQKTGSLEDARRSLQSAGELRPEDVKVHLALAEIFERLGDTTRSEVSLRRVVSLSPQNLAAHVNLGLLLIETKQFQSAEESLLKAIAIDPGSSRAASALGWAQLELGKLDAAEKNLRNAISLDGTNAYAHNNLGVLLQRSGRHAAARAEFQTASRLAPDLLVAQRNFEAVSNAQ